MKYLASNEADTLDFGWRTFKLIQEKDLKDTNGDKLYGETCFDTGIIKIESGLDFETCRETVLHEIHHVFAYLAGLGKGSDDKVETTNEHIVEYMTRSFLQFQLLNPDFLGLLFNEPS